MFNGANDLRVVGGGFGAEAIEDGSIRGDEEFVKIPSNVSKSRTKKMIGRLFKEKPIICNTKKCTKCETCKNHCPAHAITMQPYPVVNTKKCIRCFCCIEICPQDAMMLKK